MYEVENSYCRTEYNTKTSEIKFFPCVYQQRYSKIKEILQEYSLNNTLKKVIDFGCAELGFFKLLKSVSGIERLIHIDIDETVLNDNFPKVKPLLTDYLNPKKHPFHVQIFKGSIGVPDPVIIDANAIICIELIEHLYPDVLEEVPFTIFGVSQPDLVIFTTPNVEYNILFSNPNKLRNYDHKFEWTRVQFQDWAQNLCLRFPNYSVTFTGVGPPPVGYEVIGFVTQIAIFSKSYTDKSLRRNNYDNKYELIFETKYPTSRDNRTLNQKVLDEIHYKLARLSNPNDDKYNDFVNDGKHVLIPITEVLSCVEQFGINEKNIINILADSELTIQNNKYFVVKDVFHSKSESESSEVNSDREINICNMEAEEIWD